MAWAGWMSAVIQLDCWMDGWYPHLGCCCNGGLSFRLVCSGIHGLQQIPWIVDLLLGMRDDCMQMTLCCGLPWIHDLGVFLQSQRNRRTRPARTPACSIISGRFGSPIAGGFHDCSEIAWGLQDFGRNGEGTMGHEMCGVFAPRL